MGQSRPSMGPPFEDLLSQRRPQTSGEAPNGVMQEVYYQIENHLLQLDSISQNERQIIREFSPQRDAVCRTSLRMSAMTSMIVSTRCTSERCLRVFS